MAIDRLAGIISGIRRVCFRANSRIFPRGLTRTLPHTFVSLPRNFNIPERPLPFIERSFSFIRFFIETTQSGKAGTFRLMQRSSYNIRTIPLFSALEGSELICGGLFNLAVIRHHGGYARSDFIFKPSEKKISTKGCIEELVGSLSWFFRALPCAELYLTDKKVLRVWSTHPKSCIRGVSDIIKQARENRESLDRPFFNFVTETIKSKWLKTMRLEASPPLKF